MIVVKKANMRLVVEAPGVIASIKETEMGEQELSLPKNDIPALVRRYIDELESGTTEEWCQCKWLIHPDDVDIKAGQCRNCLHMNIYHTKQESHNDTRPCVATVGEGTCPCTDYQSRRVRRIDDETLCPVHSKQGLILGFFEWRFGDKGKPDPVEEDLRSPNEWLDSPEYNNIMIRDCDGWTYSAWIKHAPITKEEFQKRLSKCTIDTKDAS